VKCLEFLPQRHKGTKKSREFFIFLVSLCLGGWKGK